MLFEIKRKAFHLLGLIYVFGLYGLPRPSTLILLTGILLIISVLELIRLKFFSFNNFFSQLFSGIMRDSERNRLSGVFWMILGVVITAFLVQPPAVAAVCLLYLILGDTAASLVGKAIKGPHWPGSHKRVSGSLACFLVCLVIGILTLTPDYGWQGITVGALAATILEFGFFKLNDNLTIPVGSALVHSFFLT